MCFLFEQGVCRKVCFVLVSAPAVVPTVGLTFEQQKELAMQSEQEKLQLKVDMEKQ